MRMLTHPYTIFCYFILSFSIVIPVSFAHQNESVALVVNIIGPAFVEDEKGIEHELQVKDMLYNKAKIRTELGTNLVLRFSDGTLIMLKPSTQLNIIDYQYNPSVSKRNRFVMSLQRGDMQVRTGKIFTHHNKYLFIKTPVRNINLQGYAHNISLRSEIYNVVKQNTLIVNMVEGDMCVDYTPHCIGEGFNYRVMYTTKQKIRFSDNLKIPTYFKNRNPDLAKRYSIVP